MKTVALAIAVAVVLLVTHRAAAHEIGATRVDVRFAKDGSYSGRITVDPANFLSRLRLLAGIDPAAESSPAARQKSVNELASTYLQNVTIAFDGHAVTPQFVYSEKPGAGSTAEMQQSNALGVVELSGRVPAGARTFQWTYAIPYSKYALEITRADGQRSTEWLEGGDTSTAVPLTAPEPEVSRLQIIRQYLVLGFTHIVPKGLDHILFVLGIFLLAPRVREVLTQVTAFTVAHSITLGLTIYGVVSLPSRVVEPLIAVSIACIAIENLMTPRVRRTRVALVFCFGLLHGMGFAGVLSQLGLPRQEFLTALLSFNVGVEAGQLAVIGLALVLLVGWSRNRVWYRRAVVIPASALIGLMGVVWTIQRINI